MSLRFRTERAFKDLLEAAGCGLASGDLPALQLLTSQEASLTTLSEHRVVIQALQGPQITPKTRNLRMKVLVHVETSSDPPDDAEDPEEIDPETLSAQHCEQVDRVAAALNVSNLATELSRFGQMNNGQFTCFGVVGEGDVFLKPENAARILRTSWGYTCTVAQQAST